MNRTYAEYIVQYLVDRGVVNWASVTGTWPTIVGQMPDDDDSSDQMVSVLDTGSEVDGVDQRSKVTVEHPTFSIFIRAADYPTAFKKGKEIEASLRLALRQPVSVESDSAIIQAIQIKITTTFLKEEEKNRRQVFLINIQSTLKEV